MSMGVTRSALLSSIVVSAVLVVASPAPALSPDEIVPGANHHLGDESFVARFGRAPGEGDSEPLRMRVHLEHVRALLGERPATRPELAARRAELLGYLDDYIAKGVTPMNVALPWRNPVFVDPFGNVCAVGYLIERSVDAVTPGAGRALVEAIADRHRFDYLEDIDMPEVVAWVAMSGLTLEELASIQPGYIAPEIETWHIWAPRELPPADGPWEVTVQGATTWGAWRRGQMHGHWERVGARGEVLGRGDFVAGRGTWQSFDADHNKLAEGRFDKSLPNGEWTFFHPSGRVAARGEMSAGRRSGRWTFYHDADNAIPVARGAFGRGGRVTGRWRHFDARGALLAETWDGRRLETGDVLRYLATPVDGFVRDVAEGTFAGDYWRLDKLSLAGLILYERAELGEPRRLFDASGHALTRGDGGWARSACGWDGRLRRAAERGDVERVLGALVAASYDADDDHDDAAARACDLGEPLDAAAGAAVDQLLARADSVRAPTPSFVRALMAEPDPGADPADPDTARYVAQLQDLGHVVAGSMTWYIEWPHVDGAFARVFATLPSHYAPGAFYDPDDDGGGGAVLASDGDAEHFRVVSAAVQGDGAPIVTFR